MTTSLSREALLAQFCKPLEGHASMSDGQVAAQLQALAEWHLVHGAIERTFQFTNYWDTLAFINAIAFVIHREDHHPEIALSYNRAVLRFNTHSVSGISVNDFICAAKCDALYIARPTPAA